MKKLVGAGARPSKVDIRSPRSFTSSQDNFVVQSIANRSCNTSAGGWTASRMQGRTQWAKRAVILPYICICNRTRLVDLSPLETGDIGAVEGHGSWLHVWVLYDVRHASLLPAVVNCGMAVLAGH